MQFRRLGNTSLQVAPLVLGGNVFGWTADRDASFAVLDRFLGAGFNAIDTADWYTRSIPGLRGGESETLLGQWIHDRGVRDRIIIITKAGLEMGAGMEGLSKDYLPRACEASLRRLQTDHIDVYMAHRSDPKTPIEETLGALQELIDAGKVRYSGASNYSATELHEAIDAGARAPARYEMFEPHYNLMDRDRYEGAIEALCQKNNLGVLTYYSLASGFLTGKYRDPSEIAARPRKRMLSSYLNARGMEVLRVMTGIATRHHATLSQIALAWIMARPSVTAPIASATTVEQLDEILKSVEITLSAEDLAELHDVSAPAETPVTQKK
jgi:aryl-alcohol dehydrogenase-like predicted oxidoreductase